MIIQDIVNLAKYSELFGVAVKDDIDAITSFINLGMPVEFHASAGGDGDDGEDGTWQGCA